MTEKLSDTLGFMWRKGILTRYPAPKTSTSQARWAYTYIEPKEETMKPVPTPVSARKQGFIITEHEDGILIEFEKFQVYVRQK